MTRLVITPDDYYTKQEHYTFIVYDFETGKLEYIKDKSIKRYLNINEAFVIADLKIIN